MHVDIQGGSQSQLFIVAVVVLLVTNMEPLPNDTLLIINMLFFVLLLGFHSYVLGTWLHADTHTQQGMRGGLGQRNICLRIYYYISLLVSCAALCVSFYVHVTFTPGVFIIFVFAMCNIWVMVFDWALLKKDRPAVFFSLVFVLLAYLSLLTYTIYSHPVGDAAVNNDILLWGTHLCNTYCVVHVLIFDMWIWQCGWWEYLNLLTVNSDCESDT
jgi:hypothetical protein